VAGPQADCTAEPLQTTSEVDRATARQGGGAGYQWTRKVARKTITVALNAEEFFQNERRR